MNNKDHTVEKMIPFIGGVNLRLLTGFYNSLHFNQGRPMYSSASGLVGSDDELARTAVICLSVPQFVRNYLAEHNWEGEPLQRINVSSDAILSLASIVGLPKVVDSDQFRAAAVRNTLGDRNDSHCDFVQQYFNVFPHLRMALPIKGKVGEAPIENYRVNEEALDNYGVLGVIPAPILDSESHQPILHQIGLNIPHKLALSFGGEIKPSLYSSPKKVRGAYHTFLR